MNDLILQTLRTRVDQMVARIPARATRIEAMREELLAHLLSIYDDELSRNPDEPSALDAALRRFGASESLREELASCVPVLERTLYLILARKGYFMWRVFMILGVLAFLMGMGFVCPALAELLQRGEGLTLSISLLIFGSVIALSGVWSFGYGVKKLRARTP